MPDTIVHLVPATFDAHDGIVGGAERYALELARHMAERRPTRLVSFGRESRRLRVGALEVRVLGRAHHVRGARTNPIARGLLRELAGARVVHCHQQHVLASSMAAIFGRLTGRRIVVTDLGGGGWDLSSYVRTDALYHAHLHISRYSRAVFGHDQRHDARVILGGVDSTRFRPADGIARRGVLFVGRLLPHKGVDYLIDALPRDMELDIIGRPYDAAYRARLEAAARGKQVRFHFDATDERLLAAYQRARCVVLPSVYVDHAGRRTDVPELLGQTLLEGMAAGAAVIGTAVGSLPEVITDGETGRLVPPNDVPALRAALEWMRDHPDAAQRMGDAGRRRAVAEFSWDRVVERCLEAYDS